MAPRPVVPSDRSEFERSAALLNGEKHRRWLERPYLFIFPVIDVIVAFVAAERVRSHPRSSFAFMFWGEGIFVFAFMLLYMVIGYSVFRGKVQPTTDHC